jgi:MFS family permease
MVGRVFIGLGLGLSLMTQTVYLSELAPTHIRGSVVAVYIVLLTVGQVFANIICLCLGRNWRLMLGLAGILACV